MAITQQAVIKRLMHSLDVNAISTSLEALNQAIAYATGGYLTDATSAINKMLKELDTYGASKFLSSRCGINLSNADTGAITGSDAGGSTKTAASIVPESGKLDTSFNDTSFTTKDGLTVRLYTKPSTDDEKYIWQALKTWWAESGLNLVKKSYGYSFKDSDVTFKELIVKFAKSGSYLAATQYPRTVNGYYAPILTINTKYYNDFTNDNVDGASEDTPGYLDRTLSHELTHVMMMAKVDSIKGQPQFILEGLAELTHGIDDLRTELIEELVNSPSKMKSALMLTSGSGTAKAYAGGYVFLRWLAKQGAINYSSATDNEQLIFGDAKDNSIVGTNGNDSIYGAAGNDTIKGGKGKDILWGEEGRDYLLGGAGADTLNGGSGKDTLSGGSGNDLLTGGAGSDVFIYASGNDTITDYAAGDKISLNAADISRSTVKGSDVVFSIGNDKLTVEGAKGERITLIDTSGKEYSTIVGGTTLIVNDLSTSPVTVSSGVEVIDASERTSKVKITANKLDNTIIGGSAKDTILGKAGNDSIVGNAGNDKLYGGTGNDTLIGGLGNDSLWGNSGADVFIYKQGDGKDIIYGFDSKDTLTLNGLDFTTTYDKSNKVITFNVDGGSITLKDFTASTFNINNDAYKISGSKLVKK